ncbi:MAG: SDR family NAD(P)-dependent oxidoreductase [Pseudomonadota bacterium]
MSKFRSIVLTGASSGIGHKLAERLAAPGVRLLLIARRADALASVAESTTAKGAVVKTASLDVRDKARMAETLLGYDLAGPVDLIIANAGISAGLGPNRTPEANGVAERLNAVNVLGALNTIEPLLPGMIDRRAGMIALMSSLAAHAPLPDMPSYSASKAAVRAYGFALRAALREKGVGVSVVCPGFVESPMTARHHGFKPFQISATRAADITVRGLERGKGEIAFPWPLVALTWLSNRLPPAMADRALQGFRAEIEPEE